MRRHVVVGIALNNYLVPLVPQVKEFVDQQMKVYYINLVNPIPPGFFCVVGVGDHPFGTGYFVLLLTLMCQLGCALHVSAPRNVPVGPQAVGLPPLLPVCQAAQDGH